MFGTFFLIIIIICFFNPFNFFSVTVLNQFIVKISIFGRKHKSEFYRFFEPYDIASVCGGMVGSFISAFFINNNSNNKTVSGIVVMPVVRL